MLEHEFPLVTTIALGFTAAFACGLIASKLRLSPIVGYLIAGILIGPYTPGVEADVHIAEQLAELGILLLMFGVGLHLSLRDLLQVRHIAVPGAIAQIATATLLGGAVTYFWGWSLASGLMLGLALSVASTVVLLRALEEHDLLESTNGNIVIGWLIVEDIVMVLALVLIPVLATDGASTQGKGLAGELVLALSKVVLFVSLMLLVGKRVLPKLLMVVARTRSRELFTLSVFAVAMGVAFAASKLFGVSLALGAFFAGMMIRESDHSQEAADKALPLQDAFAVLFFVSVGMLFNPTILMEQPLQVLAVVLIIVVGKSIAAMAIVLMFGYPLKTALMVSAGLAQIGEFSFILASLGVAYGLLSEDGRSLILAGALISIMLNPAFFHLSRYIYKRSGTQMREDTDSAKKIDSLGQLAAEEKRTLNDLVILVGHGRVGKHVAENIHTTGLDLVVIDANRERVEALREQGIHAVAGDATHKQTLKQAAIERAVAIIVAVPNPYEARRIVELAKKVKPDIRVLVRAVTDEEMDYFAEQQDVSLAIMGPREVARRMVEYLQSPGLK